MNWKLGLQTFHTMWEKLGVDYPQTTEYFKNSGLDSNIEKWASAFKSGVFRAGVNSTQRGEGMKTVAGNIEALGTVFLFDRLAQLLLKHEGGVSAKDEDDANGDDDQDEHLGAAIAFGGDYPYRRRRARSRRRRSA